MAEHDQFSLELPSEVITINEVDSLCDELDNIESFFLKMKAKASLSKVDVPNSSTLLESVAKTNNLNLMKDDDRQKLKLFFHQVRTKAPEIHISFGSVPETEFLLTISKWFRKEINPFILLSVGLQPNIGAGFKLRTLNKLFDFSLSQHLVANKNILVNELNDALVTK
jgi:F0F1-type ATP synthase delta subunit